MTHDQKQCEAGTRQMPLQNEMAELYRCAFAQFGTRALWDIQQVENPTLEQVLTITRQLRIEGNMDARKLAERIEQAARAHL